MGRHDQPVAGPERCQAIIRRLARDLVDTRRGHAAVAGRQDARIASLQRRVADLEQERAAAQRQLEAVYASETWRAGAALLWLPKKVRNRRRRR